MAKTHAATKSRVAAGIEVFVPKGESTAHKRSTVNCSTAYEARKACRRKLALEIEKSFADGTCKYIQFSGSGSSSKRSSWTCHKVNEPVVRPQRERWLMGQW